MNEIKSNFEIDSKKKILVLFLFSFIVRLTIGMGYINSYDTEWNIKWAVELSDGFFNAYEHLTKLDYPPIYLYPLYLVGRLIKIEAIGGYQPFRMLAIKFFPCLADSLTCVMLYKTGSKRSSQCGIMSAALWAINPASIFNCGFWGQTDCVMIFMSLILFWLLGERRTAASGAMFAVLCSTKLQGVYLTPVVGMELLVICFGNLCGKGIKERLCSKACWKSFCSFFAAMLLTLIAVYLPFVAGSRGLKPLTVYMSGVETYKYCTFNADNIYFMSGLNGVEDSLKVLGNISVATFGSIMLIMSVVLVALVYVKGKRHSHWLAAFMLTDSIFMLTCRQHERYQILTLIMLMGAFIQIADKRIFTLFWMHALVIFANESRVLGCVHERGANWIVYGYNMGLINSTLNFILFIASMIFVLRYYFDEHYDQGLPERIREMLV